MSFLRSLYFNFLFPAFIFVMRLFVNGWIGLCALMVGLIVLSVLRKKTHIRILSPILSLLYVLGMVFLVLALLCRLVFFLDDLKLFQSNNSNSPSATTPASNNSSSKDSTKTNTSPDTTETGTASSTYQETTKQLYYTASCSNCYNSSCDKNGYFYNGYDEYSWAQYKTICETCQCLDIKSKTFYK